jgi:hypothetical protein
LPLAVTPWSRIAANRAGGGGGVDGFDRALLRARERDALGQRHRDHRILGGTPARAAPGEAFEATGQRHAQHFTQRSQIVIRHPARERQQVRRHHWIAEHVIERHDLIASALGDQIHHHAAARASAKAHAHRGADGHTAREPFGHAVRERLAQRQRQCDLCER